MNAGPKKTISILIPEELHQELIAKAEQSSRSVSSYIRQVLKAHLRYLEHFRKD